MPRRTAPRWWALLWSPSPRGPVSQPWRARQWAVQRCHPGLAFFLHARGSCVTGKRRFLPKWVGARGLVSTFDTLVPSRPSALLPATLTGPWPGGWARPGSPPPRRGSLSWGPAACVEPCEVLGAVPRVLTLSLCSLPLGAHPALLFSAPAARVQGFLPLEAGSLRPCPPNVPAVPRLLCGPGHGQAWTSLSCSCPGLCFLTPGR